MLLFALCPNPLIWRLEQQLRGVWICRRQQKTAVVAYADDVSILMTTPDDIKIVNNAIRCFEKANGAMLNISKSQTLAVGTWDTSREVLDIWDGDEIKVLAIS
jgi:hypothetical protein